MGANVEYYNLHLGKHGISANRYRELKYFCRQYREKKSRLCALSLAASSMQKDGGEKAGALADMAARMAELERDIALVEQAAEEAGGDLAGFLISNVADGLLYQHMGIPCSRAAFYRLRREFYGILDKLK